MPPKTDAISIRDKDKALKKVWYTTAEKFEMLLQRFNGDLKKIAEFEKIEYKAVLNKVRHYEPYVSIYEKFEQDYTRTTDNIVRIKVNKLKNNILQGFAKLLENNDKQAILQGMKDLITPIIHEQSEDTNIQVNNIVAEKSLTELSELTTKLLNSEKAEKI
jgi:hypothetical protein